MSVDSNTSAIYKMILLQVYPIGTIYETMSDNDPNEFIGGKWRKIAEGRMFIGLDESDTKFNEVGKTGGEANHTLLLSEIPSHNHTLGLLSHNVQDGIVTYVTSGLYLKGSGYSVNSGSSGKNLPHNNMPPYRVSCAWERIS